MLFSRKPAPAERPLPGTVLFHLDRLNRFLLLTKTSEYRYVPVARAQVNRAVLDECRLLKRMGLREGYEARVLVNAAGLGYLVAPTEGL